MDLIERQLIEFIRATYELMGWPGVAALMAVESASIPLPSELIMPLAGWMLIKAQGLDASYVWIAGFWGALGCTIGSAAAYAVGYWGGRPLAERYGRYVLVTRRDLDRAQTWFEKYGSWVAFFSRLLPVVRTFVSMPAGIARMSFWRFLLFTFLGSYPWSLGLAYGGYLLGEHWENLRSVMRPFDIPIILAVVALNVFFLWRRLRELRAKT